MIIKSYSSEGIVLARRNYSEADRILIIFSKEFGKLSLLAKGVRKLKSRKRAHIEIFNNIRFSAVKGKSGLDIITETEVTDSFSEIKKNLKKVALAYFFMEVIGRMTREGERHTNLYNTMHVYLENLKRDFLLKELKNNFIKDVLVDLGFWSKDEVLKNPNIILDEILEKPQYSVRVGKKLLI